VLRLWQFPKPRSAVGRSKFVSRQQIIEVTNACASVATATHAASGCALSALRPLEIVTQDPAGS